MSFKLLRLLDAVVVAAALCSLTTLLRRRSSRRTRGYQYPPTPNGLPILGNALQIPAHKAWVTFQKMADELKSNIIHLNAAGESIVVLNSVDDARELLEKRSAIYSSRRQAIMANELMGWRWLISSLPYGEEWKERRKLFQKHFHRSDLSIPQSRSLSYVRRLLPQLLDSPDNFLDHIKHLVGGIAFSLAYGIRMEPTNDPTIRLAEEAIAPAGEAIVPGAYLVDVLPFLRNVPDWFPGAGFKRKAKVWRKLMERFRTEPFEAAEHDISMGTAQLSLTSMALDKMVGADIMHQKEVIKDTAAMVFTAGSDTTMSSLTYFILAMISYPEVQEKAQKEIAAVVGSDRLPDFSDRDQLPYVSAIVEELLRWWPAAPMGVPHYSTEDDVYEGYFIPKNAVIIANAWAMLHNENDYPEAHLFNPDRYIKDGKFDPQVPLPSTIAFGFGRRVCPGVHIATTIIWLTAATILATFELSKGRDENGNVAEPVIDCEPGLVGFPQKFKCTFTPRSRSAEILIRSSAGDM